MIGAASVRTGATPDSGWKKTVRYGLIGGGMMGQERIRNIALLPDTEVVATFGPDSEVRQDAVTIALSAQESARCGQAVILPEPAGSGGQAEAKVMN
ncbi:MAG: hypothetical protein OXL68_08130 [Paracoccaceae bacterium]|nr:hypothetical protein [Paracoccaceae bacterium]